MPAPTELPLDADAVGSERWVELRIKVPSLWRDWLREVAEARALSVSAIVRQCIRDLMVRRHDDETGS
jgi:hypothetical protein